MHDHFMCEIEQLTREGLNTSGESDGIYAPYHDPGEKAKIRQPLWTIVTIPG
jgi:hypothetical protein